MFEPENQRIPTSRELGREVSAWERERERERERNRQGVKIERRFTTEQAREKFHRFYPILILRLKDHRDRGLGWRVEFKGPGE